MDQNRFRRDTARAIAVPISTMQRHEQIAWLRDFVIGLALAAAAGAAFTWAISLSRIAWTALR